MGLHLCYELGLPSGTSVDEVGEYVRKLYDAALHLPFERVGPLVRVAAGEMLERESDADVPFAHYFRLWAGIRLQPIDPATGKRVDRLPEAIGFTIMPGRGCEGATFGLAWVPPEDEDGNRLHDEPYVWHWHTVCKTQYASIVSDEHLIRCHTSLVALLDEANRMGFQVTVRDETHYWETRDTDRLLAEVYEMNRIVARIAGKLNDALSEHGHVDGAIFHHPRFEELETRDEDATP